MPHPTSLNSIVQLSQLITKSIGTIQEICDTEGFVFPDLNDPFTPESEAFRANAEAAEAADIIASAAFQLIATVSPPPAALYSLAIAGIHKSACIHVVLDANIPEILREAGPAGLHADDISVKCSLPAQTVARILRFLSTSHIFREVTPNVFANTRLSSALDTGKSLEEIKADPKAKLDDRTGVPAIVGHHVDETMKAASYLSDSLFRPKEGLPSVALNHAFNTADDLWAFFGREENGYRHARFGQAMMGAAALQSASHMFDAYDWDALSAGAVVVDVGSGIGTVSYPLAEKYPHFRIINQDLPAVIDSAEPLWKSRLPGALESGRVQLQKQSFFEPQPVKNADVFLLKQILHDWADPEATIILKRLREAAQPHTKLVVIDNVTQYACSVGSEEAGVIAKIPGAVPHEAPAPLLANYGPPRVGYAGDILMMIMLGAIERTSMHFVELLRNTGWKVTRFRMANSSVQSIEAVPA